MADDQDPALSQEGVGDDAATVTDPPVTEDAAESSEESGEGAGATQDDGKEDAASEEFEIVVEGEEPPPPPPKESAAWARIRKENRELKAWRAEQERKAAAQGQPAGAPDPGPEPTLAGCDFDEGEFKKRVVSHREAVSRKEAAEAEAKQKVAAYVGEMQALQSAYAKGKQLLSRQIPDFVDAEAAVIAAIDPQRQDWILAGADDSALVVCALGQRPKLLEDFVKETNPVRFAKKLAKLEASLKKSPKSQVPPPEKPVSGSGAVSGGKDSTLERLRAQADKTGDRTAVTDYLRKQREAKR
jgi:hypothetical protein